MSQSSRRFLWFAVALLALAGTPWQAAAAGDPYAPVLPALRDEVRAATEDELSRYSIDVKVDPAVGTLAGTLRVEYVNTTGRTQTAIPFRLYPNAPYYNEGGLAIERVRVNGERVEPAFSALDTVMTVPLETPLRPERRVKIALRFTVTAPLNSTGTFGIFSRTGASGTWVLANWYPILAGWERGVGWHVDPPTALGDPTFSETALYDVSLTVPDGWTPVASGSERLVARAAGAARWQIDSGPAREFTMVLDDDFAAVERLAGSALVTAYTDGSGAGRAGAEIAIGAAAASLRAYGELFGPYPFTELDLVETELAGALGVSWSGIIFLDSNQLLASQGVVAELPERLRFTVAHEVGHQWWGGVVGVNSNDHTFLLEGLTNYLAVVATEMIDGPEEGARQFMIQCVAPFLQVLERSDDGVADQPIDGELPRSFVTLIYGKSAIGFHAIRLEMGDEAYFAAIAAWAERFAFGIAEPEDLLAAFEAETGADVAELWRFWFESAETTVADVEALLP